MAVVLSASLQAVGKLPAAVAVLLGVAALVAVATSEIWSLVRTIGVIAHEGAHALTGACLGWRVDSVRLNANGTGKTSLVEGSGSGVTSGIAGYLGPSGFGVAAAALIAHGQIVAVLWIGVILLAILLPSVRTVFGVALVVGTGFMLFSIARSGQAWLEQVTAYGLSWLLLLSGVRSVLEHRTEAEDAHALRDITHLPRVLWFGLWLIGSVAALAFGAALLVQ
jgi:Peptidase M50B-like